MSKVEKEKTELTELREKIDRIDHQVVELLNERVTVAVAIGKQKRREGTGVYVPSREEQVFEKILSYNKGPLKEAALRRIYREIISASIVSEQPMRIAYLGPEATFTHQAAMKNFGSSAQYLPLHSIADVFRSVQRAEADYGVVPIENSTEGAVFHSLDTFVESDLKIVAQVYLPVEHCLISDGTLPSIRKIYSKDQALGQCRSWLQRFLPKAVLVEVASTSEAIKRVAKRSDEAAIGSSLAAELYGVGVVKRGIQDREDNTTRFLVVGVEEPPAVEGCSFRSSLMVSIPDKVGALRSVLDVFSDRGINLVKIESRPSRRRAWDYLFFIDFIGHREDPLVQEAFDALQSRCPMVKWLGSYPETGHSQL